MSRFLIKWWVDIKAIFLRLSWARCIRTNICIKIYFWHSWTVSVMLDPSGICWFFWGAQAGWEEGVGAHQRDVGLMWGCNSFGCQAPVASRLSATHCDMNQRRLQQISAVLLRPVNTARVHWPKAQTWPVCQGCSCDPHISHLQPFPKDSWRRSVRLKCFQQANWFFCFVFFLMVLSSRNWKRFITGRAVILAIMWKEIFSS